MRATSYALAAGAEVEVLGTVDDYGDDRDQPDRQRARPTIVTGNAGANMLDGGGGADVLLGPRRQRHLLRRRCDDVVVEDAGEGFDIVYARSSYTLSAGSEIEVLGTVDNTATTAIDLTGNELGQYVSGNAGANVIDGGGGVD